MNHLVRASVLSSFIVVGVFATGCPAGPGSASAAVPAPAPAAESPEQVVEQVAHGLAHGRPYVVWDALPASYQNDLSEIVHAFGAKVDADLWNQGFAIVGKISTMLRSQKELIIAMPQFQSSNDLDMETMSREWDAVVAPFITIAESDLANVSTLQTIDVRHFLATTGVEFMQDLVRVGAFAADESDNQFAALGRTKATLVSREGDSAVVRIEVPGQLAQTEAFVRVEGKWIPEDVAADWAGEMQKARDGIAQMSPEKLESVKPMIMSILTNIDGTVDQLAVAQTPQQFEQTLQMGMFQVFGGVMQVAQAMESDQP